MTNVYWNSQQTDYGQLRDVLDDDENGWWEIIFLHISTCPLLSSARTLSLFAQRVGRFVARGESAKEDKKFNICGMAWMTKLFFGDY